jgi:hypothetical protein
MHERSFSMAKSLQACKGALMYEHAQLIGCTSGEKKGDADVWLMYQLFGLCTFNGYEGRHAWQDELLGYSDLLSVWLDLSSIIGAHQLLQVTSMAALAKARVPYLACRKCLIINPIVYA